MNTHFPGQNGSAMDSAWNSARAANCSSADANAPSGVSKADESTSITTRRGRNIGWTLLGTNCCGKVKRLGASLKLTVSMRSLTSLTSERQRVRGDGDFGGKKDPIAEIQLHKK